MNFLSLFRELRRVSQVNTAELFAQVTGGREFGFFRRNAIERAVLTIGEEIHAQYLLSFTPETPPGTGFRRLRLAVKHRPELTVRARPGYWPAPR